MEMQIKISNSKGQKLAAILTNPTGRKDMPIFIMCGGHGSHKNSDTFLALQPKLAPAGISTLRMDLTGHAESEGNFNEVGATQAIQDILSDISFLKHEGYIKIGLVGSSFGAFACILAAAKTPEVFRLALKSPIVDYSDWKERIIRTYGKNWAEDQTVVFETSAVKSKLNEADLDAFVADARQYDALKTATSITCPVLIVHGGADEAAPVELSQKLVRSMPQGKLIIVPGADHHYAQPGTMTTLISSLADFIIALK